MRTLKPKKGDVKTFFGVRFVHNGKFWLLENVLSDPITTKNSGADKTYIKRNYVRLHYQL
jgi:signal peptidase I